MALNMLFTWNECTLDNTLASLPAGKQFPKVLLQRMINQQILAIKLQNLHDVLANHKIQLVSKVRGDPGEHTNG